MSAQPEIPLNREQMPQAPDVTSIVYQALQELTGSVDDAIACVEQLRRLGFIRPESLALFRTTFQHERLKACKEATEVLHTYQGRDLVRFKRQRRQLERTAEERANEMVPEWPSMQEEHASE